MTCAMVWLLCRLCLWELPDDKAPSILKIISRRSVQKAMVTSTENFDPTLLSLGDNIHSLKEMCILLNITGPF